jgi:glycosyltransferase involved in cell wall biosynthesis
VACFGQLEDTKVSWGCLVANTTCKENVELLVIDNGSTDGTVEFLNRFIFPHFPNHKLLHHEENVGVVRSLQDAYTASSGDIIAVIHNDLTILEHAWNERVVRVFADPMVGLVGFFGAKHAAANGGRNDCISNLLDAEHHGIRCSGNEAVVLFDGIALIARRDMLDAVGGFDQLYTYHHFYDKDISMESIAHGWKNVMSGVFCLHRGGVTANRSDYQQWVGQKMGVGEGDVAAYKSSEARYLAKWQGKLPLTV